MRWFRRRDRSYDGITEVHIIQDSHDGWCISVAVDIDLGVNSVAVDKAEGLRVTSQDGRLIVDRRPASVGVVSVFGVYGCGGSMLYMAPVSLVLRVGANVRIFGQGNI